MPAEARVIGGSWDTEAMVRVQATLDDELTPLSDHRGSRAYRLEVSKALVAKFLWELQP